jgi:hypothetical protein
VQIEIFETRKRAKCGWDRLQTVIAEVERLQPLELRNRIRKGLEGVGVEIELPQTGEVSDGFGKDGEA